MLKSPLITSSSSCSNLSRSSHLDFPLHLSDRDVLVPGAELYILDFPSPLWEDSPHGEGLIPKFPAFLLVYAFILGKHNFQKLPEKRFREVNLGETCISRSHYFLLLSLIDILPLYRMLVWKLFSPLSSGSQGSC